jgi:hypothetical protein
MPIIIAAVSSKATITPRHGKYAGVQERFAEDMDVKLVCRIENQDGKKDIQYEVGTDIAHGFNRKSQYAGVVEDTAPAQDSEQNTQAEQTDCIWKRAFAQQIFQYGPGHQTNDDEEQRGKQFCFHVSAFIYLDEPFSKLKSGNGDAGRLRRFRC